MSDGPELLSVPRLRVRGPLQELARDSSRTEVWQAVEPFLVPGDELKAQYALDDLWETLHGDTGPER